MVASVRPVALADVNPLPVRRARHLVVVRLFLVVLRLGNEPVVGLAPAVVGIHQVLVGVVAHED
jgi:hypothetical protein